MTIRFPRTCDGQRMCLQSNSPTEAVDGDHGYENPEDLDIVGIAELTGGRLLEPFARQSSRIGDHAVDDLDRIIGQISRAIVRTGDGVRRQGRFALAT